MSVSAREPATIRNMDEATFWALIDALDWSHEGDDEAVVEPVVKALEAMEPAQIQEFEDILVRKLYDLDGRVWARESGGGVWWGEDSLSVDGFLYARCVVVANGRGFYEAVRQDPKKMPKDMEFESLLYVAPKAYERKTGQKLDRAREVSYETFSNRAGWPQP
jgi:Protein of unknown function (DUF4240)